ncbi:MAG: AtpZ/AtpI family protein [Rhodospirillales bacterium]|jgi:ATP synthase protein I|nr:AtpZ/AtpI family protein [Rhodospirillales bacterium]
MSDEESRRSLDDLDSRIKRAREQGEATESGNGAILRTQSGGFGMAFRIGVELVAALGVGVGVGLLLDRWLDTAPWFLVVFFFLGAAAGVLNVYRAAIGMGLAAGYREAEKSAKK